jgi:hypothetical protein
VEEDVGAGIRERAFDPAETFGPVVGVQRGDPVVERPPEPAGRQAVQRLAGPGSQTSPGYADVGHSCR